MEASLQTLSQAILDGNEALAVDSVKKALDGKKDAKPVSTDA